MLSQLRANVENKTSTILSTRTWRHTNTDTTFWCFCFLSLARSVSSLNVFFFCFVQHILSCKHIALLVCYFFIGCFCCCYNTQTQAKERTVTRQRHNNNNTLAVISKFRQNRLMNGSGSDKILANRSASKPITHDDDQVSVSRNSVFNVKTSLSKILFSSITPTTKSIVVATVFNVWFLWNITNLFLSTFRAEVSNKDSKYSLFARSINVLIIDKQNSHCKLRVLCTHTHWERKKKGKQNDDLQSQSVWQNV